MKEGTAEKTWPHTRRGVGQQDKHCAARGGGFGRRPIFGDDSTERNLEDEIELVHIMLIDILSQHTKVGRYWCQGNGYLETAHRCHGPSGCI